MKKFLAFICLCALGWLMAGCSPIASSLPAAKADEEFHKIVTSEFDYTAKTFWAEKTLWVYLPEKGRGIYTVSANPQNTSQPKRMFALEYIDGQFKDGAFLLEYDVITPTKTAPGNGLSTQYTEEFNAQYRNVLTAITRAYFSSQEPPEFIVVVFADIEKGVEIQNTINATDLKKYFASSLAPEEYSVRVLSETKGNQDIIGDAQGRHLTLQAVAWPDFIARQTAQRIRYKFQNSQFPPDDTPQKEILSALATTTLVYGFKDFSSAILHDLRAQTTERFSRADVEALQDASILGSEKSFGKGELITIDFSDMFDPKETDTQPAPEQPIE